MRIYCLFSLLSLSFAIGFAQERRVSLIFAGDAMQHTPQVYAAKTDSGYNYDSAFELVKDHISRADIAGVNFETTLGGKPYTGYPLFSSPKEYSIALRNAGFNIFFTANNHALDTGREGLEQTVQFIKEQGVKQTGSFVSKEERDLNYPLMIIKNGIRIAFLNYTYGTNGLLAIEPNIVNIIDTILIKEDIEATQLLQPDIIIAVMHWGEEYYTKPTKHQKSVAQFLLNNDVRIIIGHHPHVVQPIHIYRDNNTIKQVVYYSLGNFISNQRQPNTDGGMLAEIVLRKDADNDSVIIESADHSWVWVHKYYKNWKPVYRLLPIAKEDSMNDEIFDENKYELQPYELGGMKRFVRGANKIVESSL